MPVWAADRHSWRAVALEKCEHAPRTGVIRKLVAVTHGAAGRIRHPLIVVELYVERLHVIDVVLTEQRLDRLRKTYRTGHDAKSPLLSIPENTEREGAYLGL